ncbi:MAG TPA: hypothetical protein VM690_05810, partial [Gaiellaceae bacterium]|nr:hypothetical protein [Gaiellaceae bacterium]
IASFIDHLMLDVSKDEVGSGFTEVYSPQGSGLTWVVHRHVITLDGIVLGLIEVVAVLLVAILVSRFRSSRPAEAPQSD